VGVRFASVRSKTWPWSLSHHFTVGEIYLLKSPTALFKYHPHSLLDKTNHFTVLGTQILIPCQPFQPDSIPMTLLVLRCRAFLILAKSLHQTDAARDVVSMTTGQMRGFESDWFVASIPLHPKRARPVWKWNSEVRSAVIINMKTYSLLSSMAHREEVRKLHISRPTHLYDIYIYIYVHIYICNIHIYMCI